MPPSARDRFDRTRAAFNRRIAVCCIVSISVVVMLSLFIAALFVVDRRILDGPGVTQRAALALLVAACGAFVVWTQQRALRKFAQELEHEVERHTVEISARESALRASEERYELALAAASDGLWDWHVPTGAAYFGPRWYTMLGYEPGELPASYETWASLLHPADREETERRIAQHIERGEGYVEEFRMRTKSGAWCWILARGKLVERDAASRPLRMVGTHVDITARKRSEQFLQALNRAALGMARALTPGDIFAAADALGTLGFTCMTLPLDENRTRVYVRYVNVDAPLIRAAEKLVGARQRDYTFPLAAVDVYREVFDTRQAVFAADAETVMRQVLPAPARGLAGRLVRMFGFQQLIAAPLIVENEVIGLLSVQGRLTEDDTPAVAAFAHQMAAAWHKTHLYEQAQQELAARTEAEAALREREALYRALFAATTDASTSTTSATTAARAICSKSTMWHAGCWDTPETSCCRWKFAT